MVGVVFEQVNCSFESILSNIKLTSLSSLSEELLEEEEEDDDDDVELES